jgi:hypothetical protein
MTVVPLHAVKPGTFNPDELLEKFKGQQYSRFLIIADYPDGSFEVAGNCNTGEAMWLMERAKYEYITDEG